MAKPESDDNLFAGLDGESAGSPVDDGAVAFCADDLTSDEDEPCGRRRCTVRRWLSAIVGAVFFLTAVPIAVPLLRERSLDPRSGHFVNWQWLLRHKEYYRAVGEELEIFHSYSNQIVTGVKDRPPGTPFCRNNSALFPGKAYTADGNVSRMLWEPDAQCRLKHFTQAEARECLRSKRMMFYGDSLLSGIMVALWHNVGLDRRETTYDPLASFGGARPNCECSVPGEPEPSLKYFWATASTLYDPFARPDAMAALREVDLVVLHQGTWDIGIACNGLMVFYHALKERILRMQKELKPGAQLVMFDLHEYFPGRCSEIEGGALGHCFEWNRRDRIHNFRDAIRLAAACTGVKMWGNNGIYRALRRFSQDGLHMEVPPVQRLEADVFLNLLCERDGESPMDWFAPDEFTTCAEEESLLRKWQQSWRSLSCSTDYNAAGDLL